MEDVGWRVTRIRTFDQRPLYVPNAVFSTVALENPSRMLNRRIYETIGIRYDDAGAMEQVVAEVKEMLVAHDDIDKGKTLMVNFVAFGASSWTSSFTALPAPPIGRPITGSNRTY